MTSITHKLNILSVYVTDDNKYSKEESKEFYNHLHEIIEKTRPNEQLFGDCDARIRNESILGVK